MKYFMSALIVLTSSIQGYTQCTPTGDQISYGNAKWIGYVYNARENFNSANYVGYMNESEKFDQSFSGGINTTSCSTEATTFTVRYKMNKTFSCGSYKITIGGDDGVRLSIDGGKTWIMNEWRPQAYRTFSKTIFLNGNYDMVLEFYEAYGYERVSFTYTLENNNGAAGEIGNDQEFCGASSTVTPSTIQSLAGGGFCTGPAATYQWQVSSDNNVFTDISGATKSEYTPNPITSDTSLYFRRKVISGSNSLLSNAVSVKNFGVPGNPEVYGDNSWIGYVYDGKNNFTDYKGYITQTEKFDNSFGGSRATYAINGCDIYTETFTVQYKMKKVFMPGVYEFTIGADDGVRLSLDSGNTWLIDDYSNHGYRTRTERDTLAGMYHLVMDYYEQGGGNRVSFDFNRIASFTPLPVELESFEAVDEDDYVQLVWITASELNNDYFEVHRTDDNKNYTLVDRVYGAGTTNMRQVYEATDNDPCSDICYYRLSQVDFDGTEKSYPLLKFESQNPEENDVSEESDGIKVYPNPVKNHKVQIEIPFADAEHINLFVNDLYGKEFINDITMYVLTDKTILTLELQENTPTGVYIVSFQHKGKTVSKKIFVE